jgi:hypothetical protein
MQRRSEKRLESAQTASYVLPDFHPVGDGGEHTGALNMAGNHAVEGVGGASGGHDMGDGNEANYEDGSSGDVFGISSEWADSEGNIKPSDGHGGDHGGTGMGGGGQQLNINEVAESAKAMGMSEQDIKKFVDDFTSNPNNFNPNQSDDQKRVGAAIALNDMIAAENVNQLGLGEEELRSVAGDAVQAAQAGDGAELRSILEGAGGNTGNMTDEQLVNTWSANSHPRNHEILSGDAFQLTHLRSISGSDAADGSGGDPVGYMNDKGDWTQWDAIPQANNFLEQNRLFA